MNSPDEQTDYLPIHPGDDERSRMSSAVLKSKPRRSMLLSLVVFGLTGSLIIMAHKMGNDNPECYAGGKCETARTGQIARVGCCSIISCNGIVKGEEMKAMRSE